MTLFLQLQMGVPSRVITTRQFQRLQSKVDGCHHLRWFAAWHANGLAYGGHLLCSKPCASWHVGPDQVAAALEKIISHISNPKKFKKASPLLRQLLSQGSVQKAHASLLFEVPSQNLRRRRAGLLYRTLRQAGGRRAAEGFAP